MTNPREKATFEHDEQIVVREFWFAGQRRARPRRELSAKMTVAGTDHRPTATLDIDPTINEAQTAYYRRQLEDMLLVRAEAESYRHRGDREMSPLCPKR